MQTLETEHKFTVLAGSAVPVACCRVPNPLTDRFPVIVIDPTSSELPCEEIYLEENANANYRLVPREVPASGLSLLRIPQVCQVGCDSQVGISLCPRGFRGNIPYDLIP